MKLLASPMRVNKAEFLRSQPPFAKATEGFPSRLRPRIKLRGIRRRGINLRKTLISLFIIIIVSAIVAVLLLYAGQKKIPEQIPTFQQHIPLATPTPIVIPTPIQAGPTSTPPAVVLIDVPFTPQAPFAQWSDPRQQDGCEEASVVMAMHWVRGEQIRSREAALQEILALSYYQENTFGEYRDTSAADTADRLIKGYYNYSNFDVRSVITNDEIIRTIRLGHVVILPFNGQALHNPYFTPPGPERHMMVLIGYDSNTEEYITNDPGTRQGESYRYDKDILFAAIRDYSTGYHIPIEKVEKAMIVVKRE